MQNVDILKSYDLDDLLKKSWKIRKENFPSHLYISTPSAKTYISDFHKNKKNVFVNISVTGTKCELDCEHCKRTLLEDMISVSNEDELKVLGDKLYNQGCKGVLISGGALSNGEVPLENYFNGISYLKKLGLKVIVHTGLATKKTTKNLKKIGVDQVLLDVIGDKKTIEEVYHLDKKPSDFQKSLQYLKDEDLTIAPHILVGLHFGKIIGEYNSIEIVTKVKPKIIVIVVLSPRYNTPMENINPPNPKEIGKIVAITRVLNPKAHITLGCARPGGKDKELIEKYALEAGVNGIAYPSDNTIILAKRFGFVISFKDTCCCINM